MILEVMLCFINNNIIKRYTFVPRGKIYEMPMILGKKGFKHEHYLYFPYTPDPKCRGFFFYFKKINDPWRLLVILVLPKASLKASWCCVLGWG